MESEKQPTPRQILAKAYRDNGDIGAANYIEGGSDLLPDTQVHLLAIQDALNFATTRAPADLRSALEALERAATSVHRKGAVTGSQWSQLSIALITARAALAPTKGDAS